jgi:hypothetical protein
MDEDDWGGFDDLPDQNPVGDSVSAPEDHPQDNSSQDSDTDYGFDSGSLSGIPIFPEGLIPGANTIEEVQDVINQHGKVHGYAVLPRGATSKKDGVYTTYRMECDRLGPAKPSRGAGLRKTTTKKTGCEFFGRARLTPDGWVFEHTPEAKHHVHNHLPSLHPSAHTAHRKKKSPMKKMVRGLNAYTALRGREISAVIRGEFPDSIHTIKDINNMRQKFRREEKDGCMPTGAIIKAFDEAGVVYVAKWAEDDPNQLLGIVFSFETCQKMWKRFPDCLSLDNTYRTNALGFPLFVVTAQTHINSTASVAFGLVGDETRASFDFLADGINQLRFMIEARPPSVTITDKDAWMRAALKEVFTDTQQQICRFHMNENVKLKAKTKGKWKKPSNNDDEEGLRDV